MTITKLHSEIVNGNNEYYDLGHFDPSNMADYEIMSDTINEISELYNMEPSAVGELIGVLTLESTRRIR